MGAISVCGFNTSGRGMDTSGCSIWLSGYKLVPTAIHTQALVFILQAMGWALEAVI